MMSRSLINKYFKPVPRYTACVLKGMHAGRVGEVTAITATPVFTTHGLAYVEFEKGYWAIAAVEALQRV